jgi:hypothetical protein
VPDALGFTFAVDCDDAAVQRHVDHILRGLGNGAGGAAHRYRVAGDTLSFDGDELLRSASPGQLVSNLLWHVNRQAVAAAEADCLLLHAGAVADGHGRALLLPAPMESGKTTLVAGLLRRGFDYVTDEAVAIEAAGLAVRPYPKPLSVDPGSWPVLAELEPDVDAALKAGQWQVPPARVAGPGCRPVAVVSPRYRAGAASRLEALRPAQAVLLLAENSFNFKADGRRWLPVLAALAAAAPCFRLTVGDLDDAVDLVAGLL